MKQLILFVVFSISIVFPAFSQQFIIKGRVLESNEKKPIEFATILASNNNLWAITNNKGEFTINNVPSGKIQLTINCLGYVKRTFDVDVQENINNLVLLLQEDNLALDEVVITAQRKTSELTTTYTIDRMALDHTQILNVNDISSLLPGGKTNRIQNLAAEKNDSRLALRSSSTGENGNPSFGTAIEIDGVRIDNNADFGGFDTSNTKGASTRNVNTANIESIEIIVGIPSVEHGDLTNGMVKINTKKGATPFSIDLSTSPYTKQIVLGKGFALGRNIGVINVSFDHTKSNSDLASPYTTYDRNSLTIAYSNTFNKNKTPIRLTAGFTGNIGGYNNKSDPDTFRDTYTKMRDNTYRGNISFHWLLNKKWITNIEASGSVNYIDRFSRTNEYKSSSSSNAFIHSTQEGYFIATEYDENPNAPIILGPTGYWYELLYNDNKPVYSAVKLKAEWVRQIHKLNNKLMIGADFKRSKNRGKGKYYDNMRYAPTWREDRYDNKPHMDNVAWYAEYKLTLPVRQLSKLQVMAGVRSDITMIDKSDYGTVQTFSSRINMKYDLWKKADKAIESLSVYAGWGKAVKLPSFEVLYPSQSYTDKLSFAPGTMSDGKTFYAYYTTPQKAVYNPDLKWQNSKQFEIGFETIIKGTKISLSAFRNKTYNPYMAVNQYSPISYKFTDQRSLELNPIPSINRIYSINQQTGIVTVSDRTNEHPAYTADYIERDTYSNNRKYINGSAVERRGIDWSISFPQIPSIKTSVLLNGNFYYYKGVEENLISWSPISNNMADGNPYKYVGYYIGTSAASTFSGASASAANGKLSKEVNANLTIKTHIPKIRLILSLTIESSLYTYTRNLSEYSNGKRGFVLKDPEGYMGEDTDIYGGDRFLALYPQYYSTWENPGEKIPFEEKFLWARDNDKTLYNELAKLVVKSNTAYYFNPNRISSYFSANINITKEIGNFASVSFYANNFVNSMKLIKFSQTDTELTLYNSSYIPKFYYGLALRLKF